MKRLITIFIFLILVFPMQVQSGQGQDKKETSPGDFQNRNQKLDIVLVLDNSGSMKKSDPEFLARDVVTNFLIELDEGVRLGMIIFDQKVDLAEALIDITDSEAKAGFLKSLNRVNYSGRFSDSPAAIERAIYELKTRGRKDALKAIIFLTDGIVDTGDKGRDYEKEKWLKQDLAQDSSKAGIRIIGIAFSNTADFSIMQTLAFKTGAEYFRVYGVQDIPRVFKKICELITMPLSKPAPPGTATTIAIAPTPSKIKPVTPTPTIIESAVPPPKETPQPGKQGFFFQAVFACIVVLLGVIVIIILFRGRSKTLIKEDLVSVAHPREDTSMPQALLVDVKNITSKKTLILDKRVINIGRGSNNDVAIPQDSVSGFHATIECRDDTFYLEDQRSTNMTYLNGEEMKPYSPKRLKSGDEIIIAEYRFVFLIAYQTPAGETTRVG
ncbi:MAG: FHA domain-containing protein [Deltaproteobacteria bacterium]|nr:FHA domain-containing protein [Deltaproteobacteria bacterium]